MNSANRHVIEVADADAVAAEAAERMIVRIEHGGERPAVCLTGGSGPQRLYRLLGSADYRDRIPWDRVHWFVGDERFVPMDDPLSNMGIARRLFLDRCAPASHVHAIPTSAADPAAAAQRYQRDLQDFYGAETFDPARPLFALVLMGLGPDGHTASLFPGDPALDETGNWVVGVAHAHVEPFVPRVTLTFPALASCREMLFLVSGAEKNAILSRVMAGDDLPAGRARSQGETTWLVDAAAAGHVHGR
jgi:6-phosphogluconolactonase